MRGREVETDLWKEYNGFELRLISGVVLYASFACIRFKPRLKEDLVVVVCCCCFNSDFGIKTQCSIRRNAIQYSS